MVENVKNIDPCDRIIMKLTKSLVLSSLILSSFGVMAAVFRLPQVHAAMREETQTTSTERRDGGQLLAQQTIENDFFTATLQGCNRSGNAVNCILVLRSKKDLSESVTCGDKTRIFDRFGNVYDCTKVQIGNDAETEGRSLHMRFPQGFPVKVIFTFNGVPSQVNEVDGIDIGLWYTGWYIKFRNIKISS